MIAPGNGLHAMTWTILIVDDEPPVRHILRDIIVHGFPNATVIEAENAVVALTILGTNDVDLVLSDQRMPGMDGADFLTKVKSARPAAMRVLLTGYADQDTAERAVNGGHVHALLQKPIGAIALLAELTRLLEAGRIARSQIAALERARTVAGLPRARTGPFQGELGGPP